MYWDVTAVKAKPEYKIYVETEDGRKGIFEMTPTLFHSPQVFAKWVRHPKESRLFYHRE